MTNFNLTIGAPSSTRLSGVVATKYTSAPKSNQFEATVNGTPSPAWTTEGRGSHYVYFKDGATLYYVKVAGPGELTAARQALVITTDEWEKAQRPASEANKPSRRRVKKA
ncbi:MULTISPECIES: hypothetical protein [unclassified Variovorax]|jgi:hypothetical protein|uniref:hypothetical protein n=1 Tax=unclassified Variovorax TaxID=663243 RepID=UPI000F7E4016|nr:MULTISPECIES: hypothetical protein [unclassified Variovorax]RSZ47745.1 hypothetical protein EJO70_03860 [Variovorax sp. 553]RSZ48128.1 hypothetical protein EJO71_00125 [Variovorax sp. 679]